MNTIVANNLIASMRADLASIRNANDADVVAVVLEKTLRLEESLEQLAQLTRPWLPSNIDSAQKGIIAFRSCGQLMASGCDEYRAQLPEFVAQYMPVLSSMLDKFEAQLDA
jgi:hypothetical protein